MNDNFATLIRHLDRNEIHYQVFEGDRLEFRMSLENTFATCRMRCDERVCAISVCAAIKVPSDMLPEIGEFLARANFRNIIGRWDLDWDSGHLTFEATAGAIDGITDGMLPPIIAAALGAMDRYYPAVMRILFAGWSARDAVAEVEADVSAPLEPLLGDECGAVESVAEEEVPEPIEGDEFARLMESLTQGIGTEFDEANPDAPKPKKRRKRRRSSEDDVPPAESGPDA